MSDLQTLETEILGQISAAADEGEGHRKGQREGEDDEASSHASS